MKHLLPLLGILLVGTSSLQAQTCRDSWTTSRYSYRVFPSRSVAIRTTVPRSVVTYRFGGRQHLDTLAAGLYEHANKICWEMHNRYEGNIEFDEAYAAMYKILQDTKHVYSLIRRDVTVGEDKDHIAADLHEMDALFHHIEYNVSTWRPTRTFNYHSSNAPLALKMKQFEQTLHQLMDDYGVRSRINAEAPAPRNFEAPPPVMPLNPATLPQSQLNGPTLYPSQSPSQYPSVDPRSPSTYDVEPLPRNVNPRQQIQPQFNPEPGVLTSPTATNKPLPIPPEAFDYPPLQVPRN